jgi:hypothetical protein
MSRLALVLSILVVTLVACAAPAAPGSPVPSAPPSESPVPSDPPSTPTPTAPAPTPTAPAPTPSPTVPPTAAPTPTPVPPAPIVWSRRLAIDSVDCFQLAATVDRSGRFHVTANCDGHIKYATSADGITWTSESIVPGIDVVEADPQVVVDGGRVHIAFNRYIPLDEGCGGQELHPAGGFVQFRTADGGWSTQRRIGGDGDVLVALRVVDGVVHALVKNADEGLSYLKIDGAASIRLLISNVGTGSLRIGDDGVPRIAYVANDAVRYGIVKNGKFTSKAIASVDFSAGAPELILAPGNRPFIVWTQNSEIEGCMSPGPQPSDGTYVASLSGDTWTSRRVTSAAGASSLTLDVASGDLHLAVGTDVIRHFVSANDGKTWTGAVVPNSADAYVPVIRIDPVSGDVGIAAIGDGGIVFFLAR